MIGMRDDARMFLRHTTRRKDGKAHRYWSVVENRRLRNGGSVQKTLLYLGEINDSQQAGWCQAIDAIAEERPTQLCLFPADREPPVTVSHVQIRMDKLELRRPRQWGACWLALELWSRLNLDEFWAPRLPASREGTRWLHVLKTLVTYRLIDPGSEFRLHRLWYDRTAMADLLGDDFRPAAKENLYRCLDKLLAHREALFDHLVPRWKDLFGARFEVLLYDLTSTYFEIDPPDPATSKRRHGYSRDKRSDCVQVVIALVVTPEGFPLAYEVLPGNTQDKQTLRGFLRHIEARYGQAQRIWVMDRGVPTEELLAEMRQSDPPVHYLVGTPKGQLGRLEQAFASRPWEQVRDRLTVKLLSDDGDVYVLTRSGDRVQKERAIRRRKLKRLWQRLKKLAAMKRQTREQLLMRLGAARQGGRAVLAVGPHRDRTVLLCAGSCRLAAGAPTRRPLCVAFEPAGERPCRTLAHVHAPGGGGTSLQRVKERPRLAADPSPTGASDRSAHLRSLHGVLPAGNAEEPAATPCRWVDAATRHGTDGRYPDAGRLCAYNHGPVADNEPLHPA